MEIASLGTFSSQWNECMTAEDISIVFLLSIKDSQVRLRWKGGLTRDGTLENIEAQLCKLYRT